MTLKKLEEKIDTVITTLNKMSERITSLESKFYSIEARMSAIETKLSLKTSELESGISATDSRVTEIAADFTLKHSKMSTLIDDIMNRDMEQLRERNRDLEAQIIEKESYDKRLNILIHGIDEEVNEQNL